jgi:4,5-DOPA dioxygenase extradiol
MNSRTPRGHESPHIPEPGRAFPSLFVSHGAPTLALADSSTGRFLDGLGALLPRPRAIVIASAHDHATTPVVGSGSAPRTVHDFGGFPAELYSLRYPAPGDPSLADDVIALLRGAGIEARADAARGFDHGVWVPLSRIFPDASIPVVTVSLDPRGAARTHWRVGRALAPLRERGVLVVGSGGITHNLRTLRFDAPHAEASTASDAFMRWIGECLAAGDIEALLDWESRAPMPRENHPTHEHLLPFFIALGAAGDAPRATRLHHDVEFGSLGLDAYRFD